MSRTDWFSFLKLVYNQLSKLEQDSRQNDVESDAESE